MRSYCVTSEKLQGMSCMTWVTTDTALAAAPDRSLYEVVLPPNLRGVRVSRLTQPFDSDVLCVAALLPGCGAGPSAAAQGPTSAPNQRSPFQLSRGSSAGGEFGQTVIVVGCADGTISFLYADVGPLGGQGARVQVRRTKTHNLREFVQAPEDTLPVTSLCMAYPRGAQLLVGCETGHLLLFSMTGGQFAFKQLLRSDINAPVHALASLGRGVYAVGARGQAQVLAASRPRAPEAVYTLPDGCAPVALAANSRVLCVGAEAAGVIFVDLVQNLEVAAFPAPPGDAVVSVSVSAATEEFLVATRRGCLLLFRPNGLLREATHTCEAQPQDGTPQTPGGANCAAFLPYGGAYMVLCQSGLVYGCAPIPRVTANGITFESQSETQLRVTDNTLSITDVYTAPEPVTGLCADGGVFVATTATSVIVWRPPAPEEARRLRGAAGSAAARNQWVQEPLRTPSYSESMYNKEESAPESAPAEQAQIVGGVQFGAFNFSKTEEQAARAALQDQFSPVCKSALYVRHSVVFARASGRYVALQDVSGECHVCALDSLALVHTCYSGAQGAQQVVMTDQFLVFVEGPIVHICDTASGAYVARQLVHQRRVAQVAVSQLRARDEAQGAGITLDGMFGDIAGAGVPGSAQQQTRESPPATVALLDASGAVFTAQVAAGRDYSRCAQTAHVFAQLTLAPRVLSVGFAPDSQLLVLLAQDAAALPPAAHFVGGGDAADPAQRLRLLVYGLGPEQAGVGLPPPLFASPVCVGTAALVRAAAAMGYEEAADNSARQVQQARLLQRQTHHQLVCSAQAVRDDPRRPAALARCPTATVALLAGACHVAVPLPEFPFLLERYQGARDVGARLCRYVQQPALWALECGYRRAHGDAEGLRLALAAVGQVPKAVYEAQADSVARLLQQGRVGAAVQQCCDLWDFDRAWQIVAKDRRFGPLLVYLRRQLHGELGTLPDEKAEPWQSLAREFGDRATEASLELVEK